MTRLTFIELLTNSSKEELNKFIEEKGKRKTRPAIIIKIDKLDSNLIHK